MKKEWRSEDHFDISHGDAEPGDCIVRILLWGLQLSDWMNLRRGLELQTFNIVEIAIHYEDFKSWTKVYGGQGVECDGLYILGSGSGNMWRCGLVGIGVSLRVWA